MTQRNLTDDDITETFEQMDNRIRFLEDELAHLKNPSARSLGTRVPIPLPEIPPRLAPLRPTEPDDLSAEERAERNAARMAETRSVIDELRRRNRRPDSSN